MTGIDTPEPQSINTARELLDLFEIIEDSAVIDAVYQGLPFELERFGREYELSVAGDVLFFGKSLHSRIQVARDLHFLALAQFETAGTARG